MTDEMLVDGRSLRLVAYETPGVYPAVGDVASKTYHYVCRVTRGYRARAMYAPGDDVDKATWYDDESED